jgi:NAD-dependent SIR2 family protein deacetylase
MYYSLCEKCNTNLYYHRLIDYNGLINLNIPYCPKCETHYAEVNNIVLYVGKARKGFDKRTGIFRMKVGYPENSVEDLLVQIRPKVLVIQRAQTKKRETSLYKNWYTTKDKTKTVFPSLSPGDLVVVSGIKNTNPLASVWFLNATHNEHHWSINNTKIQLKKGILSKFKMSSPIVEKTDRLFEEYKEKIQLCSM